MRIWAFGIINDPEYRQDEWRAWIAQALEVFDGVALACGHEGDAYMVETAFPDGRVIAEDYPWPFPDWSYEELPRALNQAARMAREAGAAWGVRLDPDTFIHERDKDRLRSACRSADSMGRWAVRLEKMQFFRPTAGFEKGKMPLALNLWRHWAYGFDMGRYTDLCQPIEWNGQRLVKDGKSYDTPIGRALPPHLVLDCGVHAFNYDYTFRTEERAKELLYRVELAHARFWGQGYTGKNLEEITPETAMDDFLQLSAGRLSRMVHAYKIGGHPRHIQEPLKALSYAQWGHSLWGKVGV